MSRAENILKSMLGQSVTIQKPQSRIEELLLELKDAISDSGDVSELIQRISEAEKSIEAIRTINDGQTASIDSLTSDVDSIKQVNESQTEAINKNAEETDNQILDIYDSISEAEGNIKNAETAITTLQEQVAAITKPLVIKGRVDSALSLPSISDEPDLKPGWIYFVGLADADEFDEYVYTDDSKWEPLGTTKVDLSNYVTFDDHSSANNYGVIKFLSGANSGLYVNDGVIRLHTTSEEVVKAEESEFFALHPNNIPMFMSNYGIESKTFIADNFVKRIVSKKTGLNEKAYIKIAEIKTGSSNIERITFIIAGLSNYGVSDIPVILATINERIGESEAAGQHSHARMLSAASTNLYKIGLVRRDNDNVTEVWCGSESGFNGNADILVLNKGANTILFYDVQQTEKPDGFTEIPIETVTTSSNFATTEEVNKMINEVFGDAEFIQSQ